MSSYKNIYFSETLNFEYSTETKKWKNQVLFQLFLHELYHCIIK